MPKSISARLPLICVLVLMVMSYAFTYMAAVDDYWLARFNYIMFIPGTVSVLFLLWQKRSLKAVIEPFARRVSLKALLFAVVYPLVFIFVCAGIAQLVGLAEVFWGKLADQNYLPGFEQLMFALGVLAGEEFAWRGYLLPELSKAWGRLKAILFIGLIGALWHGPMVYLLASRMGTAPSPLGLCLVQMFVVAVFSFPFAYAYFLSGSVIPPMILHYVWNMMNPIVLGNIYRNTPGIIGYVVKDSRKSAPDRIAAAHVVDPV